jgi:hypothetical protein
MLVDLGGKKITVQDDDLQIICHLPPEGYGHYYNMAYSFETGDKKITDHLAKTDWITECESVVPEENYWRRPLPPKNYADKIKEEKRLKEANPEFIDLELETYRQREWHRREYGVWFKNYNSQTGEVENQYITGPNYMYLAHWPLDTGYPKFRIADRDYYYFQKHVEMNTSATGMIEATRRRGGKTYRGGLFVFDYVSRNERVTGGVQSKTERDAKVNVFRKAVIEPYRKLIDAFRPIFDQSKGERPTMELSFFNTNKKGQIEKDQEKALESYVDWASSDPISYDGHKKHRYLHDECFKRKDSVYDLYEVMAPCLDDGDGNIIGKCLFTSTVEEMNDEAMAENVKLWLDSDQSQLDEYGSTKSGMFRFFISALLTRNVDKYGYPPVEENRRFYQAKRDKLRSDPRKLAAYKRKYPFTWQEAFATNSASCRYDIIRLEDREERLREIGERAYVRGILKWKNKDDWSEGCDFVERVNGNFYLAYNYPLNEINQVMRQGKNIVPMHPKWGVIGIDPYDHDDVKYGGGSNGAGVAYRRHRAGDQDDDLYSDNVPMIYLGRPPFAKMLFEDMAMFCIFTGYKMLFEDNKPGVKSFFREHDMDKFMIYLPGQKQPGISGSTKTHQLIVEHTEEYVIKSIFKCMFAKIVDDLIKFDIKDTTKFDIAMALGYALIALELIRLAFKKKEENQNDESKLVIRKHKQ